MEVRRAIFFPDPEALKRGYCPVGLRLVWQASIWAIKGLYLARTRAGERETWLILTEEREPD